MSLHEKAKDGTLDRQDLYQQPKGYDIDEQDSNGYTPMAYAVEGGHLNVIRTLKLNGASLTRKTADRRTLLHLAVASKQYSVAVVTYLLENGVNVDEPAGFPPNDTPLMTALRHNADTEVIEALKGAGASLTEKNSNGESAQDIADQLNNNRTKEAILPKEQQGQCRPELTNFIVSAILLAYAYLKIWGFLKDVIIAAIKQLYNEIVKPDRRKPGTKIPKTKKDFEDLLNDLIRELGLEDFFPPGDLFVEKVAEKGAEAMKDPENASKDPAEIRDLCRCALYQPVLYCDDSGSMKKDNRMPAQTEIVDRMAKIMNTFVPEDKGAHLRFINKSDTGLDNLKGDTLRTKMNFTPEGDTPLGTSLNSKVLKPFVYDAIDRKEVLKRPYLIITITDGIPTKEDVNKFQNEIVECSKTVSSGGYARDSVRFLVNQVGTDQEAKNFLDGLEAASQTAALQGILHRTADQLDTKYEELRNNKKELDIWLIKTLLHLGPKKP